MKWPAEIQEVPRRAPFYPEEVESVPAFVPILTQGVEGIGDLPSPTTVASGTKLIKQGHSINWVYLVRRGLIKLVYLSESGEEITLGLRSVGWWGGAVAAMLDSSSACSVQTVGECEVIRISARDFRERLKSNPSMMGHFLRALCNENASQTEAQARVMSGTAAERLTAFMRERQKRNPRWQTIDPLPMLKQMELAQLLSITPEHLSRLLSRMRSEQHRRPA